MAFACIAALYERVCCCIDSANNTLIGQVTGFDPDADPLALRIVTLDGCPVRMNSSGHVLVYRDAGLLNFEAKSLYRMVVSLMEVSNAMGALQYARDAGQRDVVLARSERERGADLLCAADGVQRE